jgi:hypothetical protein
MGREERLSVNARGKRDHDRSADRADLIAT